jgi:hypothetical protein
VGGGSSHEAHVPASSKITLHLSLQTLNASSNLTLHHCRLSPYANAPSASPSLLLWRSSGNGRELLPSLLYLRLPQKLPHRPQALPKVCDWPFKHSNKPRPSSMSSDWWFPWFFGGAASVLQKGCLTHSSLSFGGCILTLAQLYSSALFWLQSPYGKIVVLRRSAGTGLWEGRT